MRSMRIVSVAAVCALILGACTNDFGQFSATGGGGPGDAEADAASDSTMNVDTGVTQDTGSDGTMEDADASGDSTPGNDSSSEAGDANPDARDGMTEGGDAGDAGADAHDSGASDAAADGPFTVGGTVTGLVGSGLQLN